MNKIKNTFSKLGNLLKKSIQRFPETIFIVVCMVVIAIMTNHNNDYDEDILERLLMVLALGLPLFSTFKLVIERKSIELKWRIVVDGILAVLLIGFYFIIPDPINNQFMQRFITLMGIFYLVFILVPYFYKRKHFALYCVKLASSFLVTYLYTLVLYLGLISIIFTVDQLFNLNIDSEIYLDILFIAIGIFGVTYFLGKLLPMDEDVVVETYPIVFKVLIVSIIMPLISAYTVVLYAYFAKILIGWSWPEGLVGQLVVWYGLISMLILFSIQDLGENSPWIQTFKRFFPMAFLLPLVMMFIAIGIRITENGWTLPRYYVVLVGVWLLIMAGYFILKKHAQSTFAVLLAIILLFISIYGPLSGYSASFNSQSRRLEALLKDVQMLDSGKIIPREDLSEDKKAKITSILYYLDNLDALDETSFLPEDFELSQMKGVFGFESEYGYYPDENKYFGYYFEAQNSISPIAGYNYSVQFAIYDNSSVDISHTALAFKGSIEKDLIEITLNDKVIARQSIVDLAQIFYDQLGAQRDNNLSEEDLTYTIENDKAIVVLKLTNLNGDISEELLNVNGIEGRAWITIK